VPIFFFFFFFFQALGENTCSLQPALKYCTWALTVSILGGCHWLLIYTDCVIGSRIKPWICWLILFQDVWKGHYEFRQV